MLHKNNIVLSLTTCLLRYQCSLALHLTSIHKNWHKGKFCSSNMIICLEAAVEFHSELHQSSQAGCCWMPTKSGISFVSLGDGKFWGQHELSTFRSIKAHQQTLTLFFSPLSPWTWPFSQEYLCSSKTLSHKSFKCKKRCPTQGMNQYCLHLTSNLPKNQLSFKLYL